MKNQSESTREDIWNLPVSLGTDFNDIRKMLSAFGYDEVQTTAFGCFAPKHIVTWPDVVAYLAGSDEPVFFKLKVGN